MHNINEGLKKNKNKKKTHGFWNKNASKSSQISYIDRGLFVKETGGSAWENTWTTSIN